LPITNCQSPIANYRLPIARQYFIDLLLSRMSRTDDYNDGDADYIDGEDSSGHDDSDSDEDSSGQEDSSSDEEDSSDDEDSSSRVVSRDTIPARLKRSRNSRDRVEVSSKRPRLADATRLFMSAATSAHQEKINDHSQNSVDKKSLLDKTIKRLVRRYNSNHDHIHRLVLSIEGLGKGKKVIKGSIISLILESAEKSYLTKLTRRRQKECQEELSEYLDALEPQEDSKGVLRARIGHAGRIIDGIDEIVKEIIRILEQGCRLDDFCDDLADTYKIIRQIKDHNTKARQYKKECKSRIADYDKYRDCTRNI
jgi:hypothetical protein